jgi:hypothetical protein
MTNIQSNPIRYTCRDCKDFYDCGHELEQNQTKCEYFVLKYDREYKVETVKDLINKLDHIKTGRKILYSSFFINYITHT